MKPPTLDRPGSSTGVGRDASRSLAKQDACERSGRIKAPLTSELRQSLQRRRGSRSLLAALLMFSDLTSSALALVFANLVYLGGFSWLHGGNMLAVCLPMFLLFAINNNAHNAMYVLRFWHGVGKALIALSFSGICLLLVLFFLKIGTEYSRAVVIIGGLTCLLTLPGGRALVRLLTRGRVRDGLYAEICIYDGVPTKPISGVVAIDATKHDLAPRLDSAETISRLGELVKGMDRVVVHSCLERRADWAIALKALDIPCEIVLPELDFYNALSISRYGENNTLRINNGKLKWNQAVLKRTFDIAVSVVALMALSPLFMILAIAIKVDSRGPVLFRQERIGLGNRPFELLKFRSMYHDLSDKRGAYSTQRGDPRITKVGSFIRRTSLDELPQLVNVLIGDMSVVGPRPHATQSRAGGLLFWEVDSAYWNRHVVKPGITGLAQIYGHRGSTFYEDDLRKRLDADLLYVENWSFLQDIRIFVKTFSVLSHSNAF